MLLEGFETGEFDFGEATIHYRHAGSGPPVLLLHGNPLTHVSWHAIAPALAERYHVVLADLRGYGDSSAPEADEDYANYSFRAMGEDQLRLMAHLGHDRFAAVGHDRGARTVHRMALDHPDAIERAAVIDILPSHHVWENASKRWAEKSWHWVFMTQPPDFPERMMGSVPAEWYMEKKIGKPGIGMQHFHPEALAEYVRCFTEKTIRGSCNDYRATATIDYTLDSADYGVNRVSCPLLVVWGERSHTGTVWGDLRPIWERYADDVSGGPIDCGHYVPEEAPEATLRHLEAFLAAGTS